MTVDAGELIEQLRSIFTVDIDGMETEQEAVAVFDRACVKVLVATHNGKTTELTRGQRAAATRAKNRKEKAAQSATEPAEG